MMKQYLALKEQYSDAILFFRLGDFYEMFNEDAVEASKLLQITLTSRSKGEGKTPLCGVPYHAADQYISRLTKLGRKVAICEQLSDPNLPGIVKRDVVRIVTPGTTLDDSILERKANNFVMAVTRTETGAGRQKEPSTDAWLQSEEESLYSIAYADLTTGEFRTTGVDSFDDLKAEIERVGPAEIILRGGSLELMEFIKLRKYFERIYFFEHEIGGEIGSRRDSDMLGESGTLGSSNLLMDYFKSTQKTSLNHISKAQSYKTDDFMPLDEATSKNLELLSTLREGKKEGSLLWVLDKTGTSMGGRLLRHFLTHPLLNKGEIDLRLDAVEELCKKQNLHADLIDVMKSVMDLERLPARLSLGRGNARDLVGLKNSLMQVPKMKMVLGGALSELLGQVRDKIDPLSDLVGLISEAIIDEPPATIGDGGMIADGYNAELDELRVISRQGKRFIQNLQQQEIEKTGITNMKVRYNKVFGYYIEVSKGQVGKVPETYIRKQTLVNAERYITPELKEFEEKILSAEEKIVLIEERLFNEVRERVSLNIERIQRTARQVALLDVICSYVSVALENHYCKPVIEETADVTIIAGRHPVVEKMSTDARFISNDSVMKQNGERLLLITGPNMGGKSTYLRQVALTVLMAQIGCFVPAERATIGLVDRIFTRVGAFDNLAKGQSTFMVEMEETSNILKNATEKSLVILDEVGRGTSTYDGMSIAWAITEYLHDKIKAKTLFATHYHELISLADKLTNAANYAVQVTENEEDGVLFLYKVLPGGVDRSYGIEVARLAGLPEEVVSRANQILVDLEEGVHESAIQKELTDSTKRVPANQISMGWSEKTVVDENVSTRLAERGHVKLRDELDKLDVNDLTPMEALNKLNELKNLLPTSPRSSDLGGQR